MIKSEKELCIQESIPIPSGNEIAEAAKALHGKVIETPLISVPLLAKQLKLKSFTLKLESMQHTGSFKYRGALWRCLQLSDEERSKGVVAYSSGNFAQGLAAAATYVDTSAKIVMPIDTPDTKRKRTEAFGGIVELSDHGNLPREIVASERANEIAMDEARVLLHPFDDSHIIAGHSSIAPEILDACANSNLSSPDWVLCGAGGGGLAAGLALGFSELSPKTKVIPVEPDGFDGLGQSLRNGHITNLEMTKHSICDALQSTKPGNIPFACAQKAGMGSGVSVTNSEIQSAMSFIYEQYRIIMEPSAAVGMAALIKNPTKFEGDNVTVIITGSNILASGFAKLVEQ